jgi:hypothetical protein
MNRAFSKIWIPVIFIILIGAGFLIYQYLLVPGEKGEIPEEIAETVCSPTEIEGYRYQIPESAKDYNAGFDGEVKVDLNGDGQKEVVRAYVGYPGWVEDPSGGFAELPAKSIIVKIFSDTEDCPREIFVYQGRGNLVLEMTILPNFWGDGKNTVFIKESSYAGGSGSTEFLTFLTHRQGHYEVIKGPEFDKYKFAGENGLGARIIVAEKLWDPIDVEKGWVLGNYCAGCVSRFKFFIYTWDGEKYTKTEAGITQNLYLSESIDEILEKEPSVLNSQ